jgi:short-subunit dehydrogenase
MRALRLNLPKHNITINTVAPYVTESQLMTKELRAATKEHGIPINKAESVAKAVAYLVSRGFNGKTIFCAANKFKELEGSLADIAPQWLGEENVKYVKLGEKANLFSNKSGIQKI